MAFGATIKNIFGQQDRLIIKAPHAPRSSESSKDRFINNLKQAKQDGNDSKLLDLLREISGLDQVRTIFETNQIGVDDKKSLRIFEDLAQHSNPEVKALALETIFQYSEFKAGTIIKAEGGTDAHESAIEINNLLKNYLQADTPKDKLSAASLLAKELGYHITGEKQPVIATVGGKAAKTNNLVYQLSTQSGLGKTLYRLLKDSELTADNRALQKTQFSNNPQDTDPSMGGELARANLKHLAETSIMGRLGSWSSCNFKLSYKDANDKDQEYSLQDLINDACEHGPKKASDRFTDHYIKAVEHKETIRALNPNSSSIAAMEEQQLKALRFVFDSNKLAASSPEGQIIHEAIVYQMTENRGANRFLNSLFKAVKQPNETAEITRIKEAYRRAFKEDIQVEEDGVMREVLTIDQYNNAKDQKATEFATLVETEGHKVADKLGLSISEPYQLVELREKINGTFEKINSNSKLKVDNLIKAYEVIIPNYVAPTLDSTDLDTSMTLESVRTHALDQVTQLYSKFGASYETHIKNHGAINAFESIKTKSAEHANRAELLIQQLIKDDLRATDKSREGLSSQDSTISLIESLLRRTKHGTADVSSSLTALAMLSDKIEASKAKPEVKQAAKKLIHQKMLGEDTTERATAVINEDAIRKLDHQVVVIGDLESSIKERSKKEFAKEIYTFLKHVAPGSEATVLQASMEDLAQVAEKLQTIQTTTDEKEKHKLEVEVMETLGITDKDDPFSLNQDLLIGTLADPGLDMSFLDVFMETIMSVIDYVKNLVDTKHKV